MIPQIWKIAAIVADSKMYAMLDQYVFRQKAFVLWGCFVFCRPQSIMVVQTIRISLVINISNRTPWSVCIWSSYHWIVACEHLGNGTGRRTVTLAAPLLVVRGGMSLYFTVIGQAQWRMGGYRLVTVHLHGDLIVLSHWDIMPPAPWPAIPLSLIILPLSWPVLALS